MDELRQQFSELNNNVLSAKTQRTLHYLAKAAENIKDNYITNSNIKIGVKKVAKREYKRTMKLIRKMKSRVYLF